MIHAPRLSYANRAATAALAACVMLCFIPLAGCALAPRAVSAEEQSQVERIDQRIQNIAIELNHRLRNFNPSEKTVAVTTFVELDNLDVASSFGRFVSERLASHLHTMGFNIRELRLRKSIDVVNEKGEFALTRRAEELMREFQVDAVLVGTYMTLGGEVSVNARFISLDSSLVVSVGSMVADLEQMRNVQALLSRRQTGPRPSVRVVSPERS